MAKLAGFELPKRPPPKHRPSPKKPKENKERKPLFSKKAKPKAQHITHVHVHKFQHKKVKSFKGPTASQEARLLVTKLKEKDPKSKYQIKTERVSKKGLF